MVVPLAVIAVGERVNLCLVAVEAWKTFQRGYQMIHAICKSLPYLLYTYTTCRTDNDNDKLIYVANIKLTNYQYVTET